MHSSHTLLIGRLYFNTLYYIILHHPVYCVVLWNSSARQDANLSQYYESDSPPPTPFVNAYIKVKWYVHWLINHEVNVCYLRFGLRAAAMAKGVSERRCPGIRYSFWHLGFLDWNQKQNFGSVSILPLNALWLAAF